MKFLLVVAEEIPGTNSKYLDKIWQLIKYSSTGAVSCYSALMMNLIWFADEKCSSYQH